MRTPPKIAPLKQSTSSRPLWSVMIPAHNRADLLANTLQSVINQNISEGSMQIEVVDDASTQADIKELVNRVGKGRVQYYRQEENVGSLKNFETCLNRAQGELIHLLHSDDVVKKGYYSKMETLFRRFPEAGAAFCRYQYIDSKNEVLFDSDAESGTDGILENWLERLAVKQKIQYCAITVKREAYEKLGGFYGTTYGEDWEMWVRVAKHYPVAYTPEILALYRMHDDSISGESYITARNLRDIQWVINANKTHLPEGRKEELARKAMKFYAHYGLQIANRIWHQTRNKTAVKVQVHEALRMHKDVGLFYKISKMYTKMFLNLP